MAIENKKDGLKVERLYYAYRNLMYKEAYEILQDKHLAEDAIHESFIRIIKNLHKVDESNIAATRSFLVIICRNVAKDMYSSNFAKNTVDIDECEPIEDASVLDIVINRDTLQKVTDAIIKLDPMYRDVFIMKRVYGFSREEIAKIFGITAETVKKRLTRAKAQILAQLGEEAAGYGG